MKKILTLQKSALILILISAVQYAFAQGSTRIDLSGNPKAKGLEISIKYPQGWDPEDGNRPNIVKKFVKNYSSHISMLMVQVVNIPKEALPESKNFSLTDWSDILSEVGAVSNLQSLSLEGQKVYVGDVVVKSDRMSETYIQKQRVAGFIYKEKLVWLWCGIVAPATMQMNKIEVNFQANASICYQFFNSLVLIDRYPR